MNTPMPDGQRPCLQGDHGYTLVELMVAILMLTTVLAAAVPLLVSSVNNEPRLRDRADKIQQARTLLEQLGRDLRSGYGIDSSGASALSFRTYLHQSTCNGSPSATAPAVQCQVTYSCASGICTRQVANVGGSAPGPVRRLASGLSSNSVFSYVGSPPRFVEARIVFPAKKGDDAVTLSDGFTFRNTGLSP